MFNHYRMHRDFYYCFIGDHNALSVEIDKVIGVQIQKYAVSGLPNGCNVTLWTAEQKFTVYMTDRSAVAPLAEIWGLVG